MLVVDDSLSILADMREILCPQVTTGSASVEVLEADLRGGPAVPSRTVVVFVFDSARHRTSTTLLGGDVLVARPSPILEVEGRREDKLNGLDDTKRIGGPVGKGCDRRQVSLPLLNIARIQLEPRPHLVVIEARAVRCKGV